MPFSPNQTELANNLTQVKERIAAAATKAQRSPAEITLIAVSKFHSAEVIRTLYSLGHRDFGESYIQEWFQKREALADLSEIRWHLIGHVQRNKAKFIHNACWCLHSVDSLPLVRAIARHTNRLPLLVQLQVDPTDADKHGVAPEAAAELCEEISRTPQLKWLGFMGMGPFACPEERLLTLYAQFTATARRLWGDFGPPNQQPVLSLGMSDDLDAAIAAGSTMVRVGTSIFGSRPRI